jgi:hypothetical protein
VGKTVRRRFFFQRFAPGIWAFGVTKAPNSLSVEIGKWSLMLYKDEW